MPTPLEVLLDPISLGLLSIYFTLMLIEYVAPARKLPPIKGWIPRALITFVVYFYLSSYLPLIWDEYLSQYQVLNIEHTNPLLSAVIALMVFEFMIYLWHRTMHKTNWLWKSFHQMHHSAERVDTFGTFYFSILDIIGFTLIGSLTLSVIVGISPAAITWFLYFNMFLVVFQHSNINTPQWLGYIIQRPESHSVHHSKSVHAYNYSDLPIFDIIFGTFKNPKDFSNEIGFYEGASARIPEMLFFKDVSKP